MDSNILDQRGFSLAELGLVLMVVAVLISVSFYSAAKIRQVVMAKRLMQEMDALASVSTQYYLENGAWPVNLSDLRPKYLGLQSSNLNPFGNAYIIIPGVSRVSVSTLLPRGLVTSSSFGSEVVVTNVGSNDLVSITRSIESANWKLKYDKKYIYHQ